MKLFLASLAAAVYAGTINVTTPPDSMDPTTDSLSTVSITFGSTGGAWTVMLYGASVSDVEGYYLKVTEGGLTAATGDIDFVPASGAAQYAATFSLI